MGRRIMEYARSLLMPGNPEQLMGALLNGSRATKPIKGPIGRDPRLLPILGSDERTILGHVKVYVLEDCWQKYGGRDVHLQLYWWKGALAGWWYFAQPKPPTIGKFDALTLHPADRELLIKSAADSKVRHGGRHVPTAEEKWPQQGELRRKRTTH